VGLRVADSEPRSGERKPVWKRDSFLGALEK
jgi:hypothetical protein